LAIFLQLCDELVALLDHVLILLIFIVRAIGLNHTLPGDSINRTRNATSGDESGKIAGLLSASFYEVTNH
jgi:hypothetical protein